MSEKKGIGWREIVGGVAGGGAAVLPLATSGAPWWVVLIAGLTAAAAGLAGTNLYRNNGRR